MPRTSASRRRRRSLDDLDRGTQRVEPARRGPMFGAIAVGVLLLLAVFALGRNPQAGRGLLGSQLAPRDALMQLAQRYQQITSYEDRSLMNLRPPATAPWAAERADLLVRFQRPNKVRLQISRGVSQLLLTCDGENLQTRLLDQNTRDFDGQLVQQPAPQRLSLIDLFSASEIAELDNPGQLVSALMSLPCPLIVSQLSLLMDDEFMPKFIASSKSIDRLASAPLGGRTCNRIRVTTADGSFVFWIDDVEGLLRRIEYPPPVAPSAGRNTRDSSTPVAGKREFSPSPLSAAKVTCDFDNVQSNGSLPPDAFRQAVADDAILVRNFIVPPLQESPRVLGNRVSGFSFLGLDGSRFELEPGVHGVLVWFNNSEPSRLTLEKITAAYAEQPEQGIRDTAFIGICTEPSTRMSHQEVRDLARQWRLPFPVVRDLDAHGRDIFGIAQAPTIVVVDRNDVVQLFEVGGSSQLDQELPIVLEKLRQGESLAKDYLDFLADRRTQYQQLLAAAGVNVPAVVPSALADAPREHASEVTRLERLWISDTQMQPWQLALQPSADALQLLVLDGGRQVHEFNLNGHRQETNLLRSGMVATDLRCLTNGTCVLMTQSPSQVVFVNDRFEPTMNYPESTTAEVTDFLIDDLDDNGREEAYVVLNSRIIHRVETSGVVTWQRDELSEISALTVSHDRSGARFVLAAHHAGGVTPIGPDGTIHERLGSLPLSHMRASRSLDEDSSFAGILANVHTPTTVILDNRLEEIARTPLSAESIDWPRHVLRWAPWRLQQNGSEGCWLIVDPGFGLAVYDENGQRIDRWRFDGIQTAVAAIVDGRQLLFVAVGERVECWSVSAMRD